MDHILNNPDLKKPLLRALNGEVLNYPPLWLMRQAGRYLPEYRSVRRSVNGFLDLCYNSDLAAEVTLQPIRRYGFDAAIIFSDILVIPDALGQKLNFLEGEGPKLEPIRTGTDIAKLSSRWIVPRLNPVFEAIQKVKMNLSESTSLIGFAGAPWTVACYMIEGGGSREFLEIKKFVYQSPGEFQKLIDLLIHSTIEYLCAQIEAGADAIQIFDTWAGILPEDLFDQYVVQATKKIVSGVKKNYPFIPIIGFPRGAGPNYEFYLKNTNVSGVSLDIGISLDWTVRNLQKNGTVQGNLDPQLLLCGGDSLIKAIDRIKVKLENGPFIFNLGHGIIKETPLDHVELLVRHVRNK